MTNMNTLSAPPGTGRAELLRMIDQLLELIDAVAAESAVTDPLIVFSTVAHRIRTHPYRSRLVTAAIAVAVEGRLRRRKTLPAADAAEDREGAARRGCRRR